MFVYMHVSKVRVTIDNCELNEKNPGQPADLRSK